MLQKLCILLIAVTGLAGTSDAKEVYPVAQLPFQERGVSVKGLGVQVSDLLFAYLVTEPGMYLVDRENLDSVLKELELNLSGAVGAGQATQVGQMTGAKILLSGSVMQINNKTFLVVKIIGTETSRVVGVSVKGNAQDDLEAMVDHLSQQIVQTLDQKSDELVAKPKTRKDRISQIAKQLKGSKLPLLSILLPERHIGEATMDPAAETELTSLCLETGFEVADSSNISIQEPEVLLKGEAFSEFATRHGNLISVKARVEVKAINAKTGKVIAIDRQTSVAVDLSEQVAAKTALQNAAADIAERLLPKIGQAKSK